MEDYQLNLVLHLLDYCNLLVLEKFMEDNELTVILHLLEHRNMLVMSVLIKLMVK